MLPGGHTANLLYWQSEPWVRLRDMPLVTAAEEPVEVAREAQAELARVCTAALRLHGIAD